MNKLKQTETFEKLVINKFNLFNSLFLSLPFRKISTTGILLPILTEHLSEGLEKGMDPGEMLETFFIRHTNLASEQEKIDFMFRVIQFVERQIVLFDSVEDAAFKYNQSDGNQLSLEDFINMIKTGGSKAQIATKLDEFSARIVFTAHPTQFYPPAVLDIIQQLRIHIIENDINEINLSLQQLGMTPFGNLDKPTPLDEAKNIIYFFRQVYYEAVPELFKHVREQLQAGNFSNYDIVKLGFWPGGDRDGNPFVTAPVTLQVADELRMALMECYHHDVEKLSRKLTFRNVEKKILDLKNYIHPAMFNPENILPFSRIIDPLMEIKEIVTEQYNALYTEEIEALITKANIFKTHFATLDIRQHHEVHKKTVEAILKNEKIIIASIDELDRDQLIDLLLHKNIDIDPDSFQAGIISDTIETIGNISTIQNKNGEQGCNRYIISNAEDIFSVLFVYALLRWCSWQNDAIPFDIVPLFESMEGMQNARSIMQFLYDIPEYRAHVHQRSNKHTIMLGFSDGTKDGGYLKANWSIFKTKEELTEVSKQYAIKVIFFDGRGGPPARGGGKTHQFYAAQSKQIANHEIQLTIQGQTISSRFGTKDHFKYNAEQLITAALSQQSFGQANTISDVLRKTMDELAELSYQKYLALKNHPMFIPYLENKSTLRFYSNANIGSRPAKRGQKSGLTLSDLRAISFVGSWSQLKQNVPGYFGIGTALKKLSDEGRQQELKDLFNEFPFFKTLILNSMMSISKSCFALTNYIAKEKAYADFWKILHEEYKLSKEMVLLVSGYSILMQEEPVTKKSIEIREKIVLPLLVIQQYALQMLESDTNHKKVFEKMVTRSLYGNINASRNSA
jgi:phosphoenolpyruvate carboxylase